MGPTNTLNYLLTHVASVMSKQSDQVLHEHTGIGLSQYRIMMVLEWNPRISQSSIASALGQTEASISRQIKILQKKGLLVSKPDPLNKRRHITVPTPVGMQVTESSVHAIRRSFGPEYARIGEDKINKLLVSLQEIHNITCRPGQPGACDHQLGL
jgi:DNA-binding MarR family transcriptional regulator